MTLLESLTKGAGDCSKWAASHPQAVAGVIALLSTRDSSVGGGGGLAGLASTFQQKGLGDMMSSWIATGPNPPISAAQIQDVLGSDVVREFASKAGLPPAEAGSALAALLPAVIDHLTPQGKVPEANSLEGTLGALLGSLGR
jgi:uncharacterized protein YidB (DUF937 family)